VSLPEPLSSSTLDALLRPVDPLSPAGADLGYTEVAALERLAAARPLCGVPPGPADARTADPDWADIGRRAEALLSRTKDLRVALWYARAALSTRGLAGLAEGLALVAGLLQRYWPTLHPQADPHDDPQADERVHLLAMLSPPADQSHPSPDAESFVRALHGLVIAEARGVGVVTVRDLEPGGARGAEVRAGMASPSLDAVLAAMPARARDDAEAAARRALEALAAGRSCRLAALQRVLERIHRVLGRATVGAPAPDAAGDVLDPVSLDAAGPASRDDAVRSLMRIAAWVRAAEPSSPAPLFIDRAVTLLRMDFASIVRTLIPQARAHVELLGGVPLDADSP
jgi:type VI secretion system protein ImpA